jgi:hypothetical protein
VPISGAIGSGYTVSAARIEDAGTYTVVVSNSAGSVTSTGAVLTVNPAAVAPTITTQPDTGLVLPVGSSLTMSVVATGTAPLSYQWRKDGVPISGAIGSGYTVSAARIEDAGTYTVVVSNSAGSVTSTGAVLTVNPAVTAAAISSQPSSSTVTAGQTATFSVTATGTAPLSYQWRKDGATISSATGSTLTLSSVSAADAGTYTVVVTNSAGSVTSTGAVLTVNPAAVAPTITTQPDTGLVLQVGSSLTMSVVATGTAPLSYQWRKDGVPISGAIGSSYSVVADRIEDAGTYTVVVSNSAGAVTSTGAVLTVNEARVSRISNVSIRTTLNPRQLLIVGLTMTGGTKDVLMRAVGPGLGAFGVSNAMVDPDLSLFEGDSRIATNDNWGGGASLATAAASVGAFPLVPSSKDAALLRSFSGGRTLHVQGADGGNVIVEAYDAGSGNSPRLSNVSARNFAGSGGETLIAGFSITGNTAKRVLIRAVGPTLGLFGVAGAIADPKLEVYAGSNRIAENDNWSASLASAFSSVGAFGLTAGSRDSALEISLNPGGYTVHVTPASGSGGEVLIEIYELP